MSNPRYANGTLRRKHRARLKAMGAPCGICKGRFGPIHYDEPSDAQHPLSFAAEDWDNLQAAHYFCNQQKGAKAGNPFEEKKEKKIYPKISDGNW